MRSIIDYIKVWFLFPRHAKIFLRHQYDKLYPVMRLRAWMYRRLWVGQTKFITVTGSVGKTTAMRMCKFVFDERDTSHSYSNYGSCLAENILKTKRKDKFCVLEVGVDGPNKMQGYADLIKPQIAIVTSIKSDHNRSFKTLENTRAEKVKLVRSLSEDGVAILNGDDANVMWMATQTEARVVTFGFQEGVDLRATDIQLDWPQGTRFTLHANGQIREVVVKLVGDYMVYSVLAAIAAGLEMGKSLDECISKLEQAEPTIGRMQKIELASGVTLIDDSFKGGYDSVLSAMEIFAKISAKRKIYIMGHVTEPPGKQGPIYKDLGKRLAEIVDRVYFIGGDQGQRLRSGAGQVSEESRQKITVCGTRIFDAIPQLKEELKSGDVVLLKGTSTQQFRRIVLALQGVDVKCKVKYCNVKVDACDNCPLLTRDPMTVWNKYVRMNVRK